MSGSPCGPCAAPAMTATQSQALMSPPGGHVRGADVRSCMVGWKQAGFILFAFAAPSACVGVAYSLGKAGIVGGSIICIVTTLASMGGSLMLLRVRLLFPDCYTLGDLGEKVLGRPGKIWGNVIQLTNFVLFLPVALLLCGNALAGIFNIKAFDGCQDYYIFTVAAVCLLTTQMRTLSNTQVLSFLSLISVLIIAVLQIVAAVTYDNEAKVPAKAFGNPTDHWATSLSEAMLGTTTAAWAYVPAFLTVELATCMENPMHFGRSLALSGALNVLVFLGVGITVVVRWGAYVEDPITITRGVTVWQQGTWLNTALSVFLLVGNFVSYMLDSVPLGRYCQKAWAPKFADTWSAGDCLRYLGYTLPTFLFGVALSVVVPNLFVLLAITTALTIPWVTQIYPAVLYLTALSRHSTSSGSPFAQGAAEELTTTKRVRAYLVLLVGVVSFVVCLIAAIGKVAIAELRGPSQIGCGKWLIWSG